MNDSLSVRARRRLARLGYWASAMHLLAFGAFITVVLGAPLFVSLMLAGLVLVVIAFRQRKRIKKSFRTVGALGSYLTSRYLLLAIAVVLADNDEHMGTGAIVASTSIAAVGTSLEPLIRNLNVQASVPCVANVAGVPERSRPRFGYGTLFLVNVLLLMVAVVQAAGVPQMLWVAVVLAVVDAVIAVSCFGDLYSRLRGRLDLEHRVGDIVQSLQPQFVIHWNAAPKTAYQIAMWLPYLDRIGVPYFVLVRSVRNFRDVEAITDRPIVLRQSLQELDPIVVPSLKGAFYVNTATRNDHLIRYSRLRHIQLNHGDSDKVPSFNPVFRVYDKDFVAGQAAIDRFAANGVRMHSDLFTIVGRPQVEDIQIQGTFSGESGGGPSALYAPTWVGFYQDSNYSSLPVGVGVVRELLRRGCRVVFRPHPYSRRTPELRAACREICEMLAADAEQTGREHLYGPVAEKEMAVMDCINSCDFMISDVSSVVGDFLYSEKPFAMVAMRMEAEAFEKEFPVSRASYILEADEHGTTNLDEVLHELLDIDSKRSRRQSLKTYYLGEAYPGGPAQRFIDAARAELGISSPDVEDAHQSLSASGSRLAEDDATAVLRR